MRRHGPPGRAACCSRAAAIRLTTRGPSRDATARGVPASLGSEAEEEKTEGAALQPVGEAGFPLMSPRYRGWGLRNVCLCWLDAVR